MIKANELRIGNLVHRKRTGRNTRVNNLSAGQINGTNVEYFDSIELTYEILLQFGFKDGIIKNDKYKFSCIYCDGWNIEYIEHLNYGIGKMVQFNLYYLHQLQNLYFALTGTELTI